MLTTEVACVNWPSVLTTEVACVNWSRRGVYKRGVNIGRSRSPVCWLPNSPALTGLKVFTGIMVFIMLLSGLEVSLPLRGVNIERSSPSSLVFQEFAG